MSPVAAKIFWLIVNPSNVLLCILILGALLLFTRWRRIGRIFIVLAAVAEGGITYLPIERWLMEPLQTRFGAPSPMPEKIAGIIVLGGAIDMQQSKRFGRAALNSRADRVTGFVELARRYPEAKLIYSGGAEDEAMSEAEMAKPLLVTLGVLESRLILETKSRDTYENAMFTRDLVHPVPGEIWVVVTSASHMPRAIGAFRSIGWSVVPYPVDYRRLGDGDDTFGRNLGRGLNLLNGALREWVSLAHYYVTGRSSQFFPSP